MRLYVFDLGNVVIDVDFNRIFGVWSKLSGLPLSIIIQRFSFNSPVFAQYEKGNLSDEAFVEAFCQEMEISLSFEQFVVGWSSLFMGLRKEVIELMANLKQKGKRVVVLSNNNPLHQKYWMESYPELFTVVDKFYLSHEIGLSKPDPAVYEYLLQQEKISTKEILFFDDLQDNIIAAQRCGIESIHVTDRKILPAYFM